ncbi:GspH/FimT family pseudopilin [Pseudomonadota bacterium]
MNRYLSSKKNMGFTLIELMVTLAVLAIIATLAVPSMQSFFDKRHVIEAAEDLYSNIQQARSEAIARNQLVALRFSENNSTTWVYGISTNGACTPTETLSDLGSGSPCVLVVDDGDGILDDGTGTIDSADVVLYRFPSTDYQNVTMDMPVMPNFNKQIAFDPTRGVLVSAMNPPELLLTSSGGYQMKVKISQLGQVRICSPSGNNHVPGYTSNGC